MLHHRALVLGLVTLGAHAGLLPGTASAAVDGAGTTSTTTAWVSYSTAVPGVATAAADKNAVYLDAAGRVVPVAKSPGRTSSTARLGCTPVSGRDNPHRSSTGVAVSGHGWWDKGDCSNNRADVLNCLYEYYTDGTYRQKDCSSVVELSPGGGAGNRTTSRRDCHSTAYTSWRNHVNVDVKGEIDTNEVPMRQANVYCRVD